MKHLKPIAAGVGVLLAAALVAGCGGGGHGEGTLAGVGSNAGSNVGSAGGGTTTQSAQTATVTVTVKIPPASKQASARRNPAYVSPNTQSIQLEALPSDTLGSGTCNTTTATCTATIAAPLTTTSIQVTLYDQSGDALSTATQPVTLVQGAANNFTFVFNGIVSSFQISPTITQGVIGVTSTGTITVIPYDSSGAEIMSPGSLIDGNGTVLVSATGSTQTLTLNESGQDAQYLQVGPLTWNATTYLLTATETYNDGGAGTQGGILLSASSSASSDFSVNSYYVPVNPKALSVIANPSDGTPTAYQVLVSALSEPTTDTTIELPVVPTPPAASPVTVYLSVVSNFNDTGSPLALTNDTCTNYTASNTYGLGLDAAFPSPAPTMPSSLTYPFTLNIAAPAPNGSNESCTFTITDTSHSLSAQATFGFDNTTLNINGKKRK